MKERERESGVRAPRISMSDCHHQTQFSSLTVCGFVVTQTVLNRQTDSFCATFRVIRSILIVLVGLAQARRRLG